MLNEYIYRLTFGDMNSKMFAGEPPLNILMKRTVIESVNVPKNCHRVTEGRVPKSQETVLIIDITIHQTYLTNP
jgi:hypothetical protein